MATFSNYLEITWWFPRLFFLCNFFSSCSLKLLRVLFSKEPRLLNGGLIILYSLGGSREEGSECGFPRNIVFESSPPLKSELCSRYPKAFAFSVQLHCLIQENNVSFSRANALVTGLRQQERPKHWHGFQGNIGKDVSQIFFLTAETTEIGWNWVKGRRAKEHEIELQLGTVVHSLQPSSSKRSVGKKSTALSVSVQQASFKQASLRSAVNGTRSAPYAGKPGSMTRAWSLRKPSSVLAFWAKL